MMFSLKCVATVCFVLSLQGSAMAEQNLDSLPIVQQRSSKSERTLSGLREGKRYDFALIDGKMSRLTVDGRAIASSEFSKYESLTNSIIAEMDGHAAQSGLQMNQPPKLPEVGEAMSAHSAVRDKELVENLRTDGIITASEREVNIKLNFKQLWINGKLQAEGVFAKYKSMIEAQRGKTICENCEIEMTIVPNEGRF